ncbi:MAG: phosphoribosylformylglycinamidine synthase subunit PurL, partial [Halanaeroarchaeum sp.]
DFDREHSRYLLEGVVEGIGDYGNSIGVPTVRGSTQFHEGYEGNPLVNVSCVGIVDEDRLVTADAKAPGNKVVLVGNATGRDGLGGASFASEDLSEDAETEDRPAVQVGDPYTEKLLIEANESLVSENLVEAARDLGAAGLGGATSEMAAKGELGMEIDLDAVHLRETGMNATEILLAESQERMAYEVTPANVDAVAAVAEHYDLGFSVIGEVTDTGRYVCQFDGETVVDVPATYVADGAPMNDLPAVEPDLPERDLPDPDLETAFESVVESPNTASKRWVYRQYDHEVGVRTARRPGDDAAILAIREADTGLAISAGANPGWTEADPYEGARAVAIENATNVAAKGATPLAAVDCLNGGNPEKPDVYGDFSSMVEGLADGCSSLDVPVVGGNVSLYNDSAVGPILPTPTLSMIGVKDGYDAPPLSLSGDASLLLVGGHGDAVGGSEYLAQVGGSDRFPTLPDDPKPIVETLASVANRDDTLAVHDVSDGGLAVTLAEMVTPEAGATVSVPDGLALFSEAPGRAVVETNDTEAVTDAFDDIATVVEIGTSTTDGNLEIDVAGAERLEYRAEEIASLRSTLETAMD